MNNDVMIKSDFPNLGEPRRGKVRDIYDLGTHLLLVVTDRVSAFDVVMPNGIPDKGKILTSISNLWFELTGHIVRNHIISTDAILFSVHCPRYADAFNSYADQLKDRSVLVKKVLPLPIEAIVRGYISGSGWDSYKDNGTICGIALPASLVESEKLPEALFTPSTKADAGEHDVNIPLAEVMEKIGPRKTNFVKEASLQIYRECSEMATSQGIIIADTKFEFGLDGDDVILIDELLTPDSSRFWPREFYAPGGAQVSYDKQYLRDWLKTLDWDKKAPGPELPEEVIAKTRAKYIKALSLLENLR